MTEFDRIPLERIEQANQALDAWQAAEARAVARARADADRGRPRGKKRGRRR